MRHKAFLSLAIAGALIFSMTSCTNSTSTLSSENNSSIEYATDVDTVRDFDLKNLKWGMTVDEVKSILNGQNYEEEITNSTVDGRDQTLFNIEGMEIHGYNAKLVLCVEDGVGLSGINYHIEGEKYYELHDLMCSEYGTPDSDYDYGIGFSSASWNIDSENYSIFLMTYQEDDNTMTQFSYFPNEEATTEAQTTVSTTAELVYEELPDPDIRNLKWGMSLDEVKVYETEKITKEEFFEAENTEHGYVGEHTMLTYDNIKIPEFGDYNFSMIICVYEDDGLTTLSYYFEGDDSLEIYQLYYDNNTEKYGDGDVKINSTNSDGLVSFSMIDWSDSDKTNITLLYEEGYTGVVPPYLYCYYFWNMPEKEDNNTTTSTTKTTTSKNYCIVDDCNKEATKSMTNPFSGELEYYCQEHYNDIEGFMEIILGDTKDVSGSATTGEKNALKAAKNYLDVMPFSYSGLISQLEYEGYTKAEATYAADNCGANWKEQAAKQAKLYLDIMPFSRSELIDQLEYDGFTNSQAVYGAEQNGY